LILWRRSPQIKCFGIRVIDANQEHQDDGRFFGVIHESLDLLQRRDPVRFRRVCRFINTIVNEEALATAQYCATIRTAVLDFARMELLCPERAPLSVFVAATLVHESTHGLVRARGIHRRRCIRVERLCHREESRFLGRFDRKLQERHEGLFNPNNWHTVWKMSFLQRLVMLSKHVVRVRRRSNRALQATTTLPDK
jgi:hypothetical protein